MQGILFTEENREMIRAGVKVQTRRLMRLRTVKGAKEWAVEYPDGQARRMTPSGPIEYAPIGLHCVDGKDELRSFTTGKALNLSPYSPAGSLRYIKEPCKVTYWDDYTITATYSDGATHYIDWSEEAASVCPLGSTKDIQALFLPEVMARTIIKVNRLTYGYVRDIDAVDAIKEGVEARTTVRSRYSDSEWLTARFQHKDENCWRDYSRNDAWGLTAEQSYRTMWESIHGKGNIESLWDLAVVWIIDFSVEDGNGKA